MKKNYTDEQIIEAILSGIPARRNEALKTFYMDEVLSNKVSAFTNSYKSIDPDDILQDSIIIFYKAVLAGKFQKKSGIRTYIIGICKNLVFNKLKKLGRIDFVDEIKELDTHSEDQSPEYLLVANEISADRQKRNSILESLLEGITPNCKHILTLYYYQLKSMAQIATERGLKNAHQAKKAASRCREQLRKRIKKNPGLENFLKQNL